MLDKNLVRDGYFEDTSVITFDPNEVSLESVAAWLDFLII